ncbi:hypothetical protein KA001_00915 [Patescibacteria group bacterium]|nr:hypothetical protein [Patescibacteria group bacterium]
MDLHILKDPKYVHVKSEAELNDALKTLENEPFITVDTETTGLDPYTNKLILVQLGSKKYSYVIEAKYIKDWSGVKKMLEDESKLKILQNAKFDYKFLKVAIGVSMTNMFDTMIAEILLTCGLPRSENKVTLSGLTEKYLGSALEKEVRKSFFQFKGESVTDEQAKYAALDVIVLNYIFEQQFELLKKNDLTRVAKLEFKVVSVVGDMELRGFNIDANKWREHLKVLEVRKIELAKELQLAIRPYYNMTSFDLFGSPVDVINLNSQQQLMDLFNNRLKIAMPSTGVKVLTATDHPIAKLMLQYRGVEKLLSAFGHSLLEKINPVTKRLHPDYIQMGTATGRFSCSRPNLQQIPSKGDGAIFRTFFMAPEGKKLVTVDYSQQEMRVLAEFSGDETLLEAYNSGKDLHSLTAAQMYNIPYTDDFKDIHKDKRQAAKTINFGLVYGRGPQSLALQLGVSVDEAKEMVKKYFEKMPKVGKWLEGAAKTGVENNFVQTRLGRKRFFVPADMSDPNYNKQKGSIERESKNMPIQGTSADMTKLAMILMDKEFKSAGIEGGIIHTLHDEIVSEVPADRADEAFEIQKNCMLEAGKKFLTKCPVDAEGGVSQQWEH